jgi:hypothetical protein
MKKGIPPYFRIINGITEASNRPMTRKELNSAERINHRLRHAGAGQQAGQKPSAKSK